MISLNEALELVYEHTGILNQIQCELAEVAGRILCDNIVAESNVVSFRNSAMDGFAVRSDWLEDCSETNRIELQYNNIVFAGDSPTGKSVDNHPLRIMTGAPVPDEYDAVVKFEDVTFDDESVAFSKPTSHGSNVREPGQDISEGQTVFSRGYTLRSLDVGILASLGLTTISAYEKPSVLLATTGNELVSPGQELPDGKIYNSNLYSISSIVSPFCRSVTTKSNTADDTASLENVLSSKEDAIITTGGVSAGDRDLVVRTAENIGWKTVFHKARVKPGKPIYMAVRDHQLLFGLPGNPLSAVVTCSVFVIPALKKLCGRQDFRIEPLPAQLSGCKARKCNRTLIWPASLHHSNDTVKAKFSEKTSSQALSAVLGSDGLVIQKSHDGKSAAPIKVEALWWSELLQ